MDQDNTLAAAPAAFALLAVALNTMSLQAGDVLGVPRKWTFVYRVSPLFCILAALDSVLRLAWYSLDNRSLEEGSRKWIAHRFGGIDPRSRQTLTGWTFVQIAFVIGVLSQAIKIYTTTNIICIQLFCTAYLADYMIEYVTTLFAADGSNAVEPDLQQPLRAGQQGSSSLLDGFSIFPVSETLGSIPVTWAAWLIDPEEGIPDLGRSLDIAISLFVMLILCYLCVAPNGFRRTWYALAMALCASFGGVVSFMGLVLVIEAGDQIWDGHLEVGILLHAVQVIITSTRCGLVDIDLRDAQAPRLSGNWSRVMEYLMACKFLVTHVLGACIYYRAIYNVEETSRPAWTNYLP